LKVEALSFRFGIGEEREIKSAGEREREREKDWVFFSDKFGRFWVECFGHFEDWFLLGGLRIGLGFPEA
jgi:hypothetical protein